MGPTWAKIDLFSGKQAAPKKFCNYGILPSNDSNSVSQATIGSRYPQDPIVLTMNTVVAATKNTTSFTVSKTQCYYTTEKESNSATCEATYQLTSKNPYPAARFCPCDAPCPVQYPTSVPTKKPIAAFTSKPV
jgi:hypothetical protein